MEHQPFKVSYPVYLRLIIGRMEQYWFYGRELNLMHIVAKPSADTLDFTCSVGLSVKVYQAIEPPT